MNCSLRLRSICTNGACKDNLNCSYHSFSVFTKRLELSMGSTSLDFCKNVVVKFYELYF